MAVVATTAFGARTDLAVMVMTPHSPVRTCIGCRGRAPAAELLRVVVAPDATGVVEGVVVADVGPTATPLAAAVVPDPRRRATGRGAYVHRASGCVENAVRRRAFARALRVPGPLDPTPVRLFLAAPEPGSSANSSATVHHHQRNPAGDDEQ